MISFITNVRCLFLPKNVVCLLRVKRSLVLWSVTAFVREMLASQRSRLLRIGVTSDVYEHAVYLCVLFVLH